MERRSSGQHSGGPLVVQRGKGIEQRVISGRCAIFLSLHGRIDPETCKRDPHHNRIKSCLRRFPGLFQAEAVFLQKVVLDLWLRLDNRTVPRMFYTRCGCMHHTDLGAVVHALGLIHADS